MLYNLLDHRSQTSRHYSPLRDFTSVLGIYLATFLAITTTSILTTVIVLHIHHMGDRKVPRFVRKLVFDGLARMLCMNNLCQKYGTSRCHGKNSPMETSLTSTLLSSSRNPSLIRDPHRSRPSPQDRRRPHISNGKVVIGMKKSLSETEDKMVQQVMVQRNYVLDEILMHIKAFTQERFSNEQQAETKQEWIAVAKVLDRFFMCMFITSIALSSFLILIVLPMSKTKLEPI